MSWLISLAVLSALIFFHELGHYVAARIMGVYVEVFSIGFGKKIFGFRWLGTEWRIAAIPLGGYVRMKGQDDTQPGLVSGEDDSYDTKKPWQRIFILLAGPVANFVLAFFLYIFIGLGGPQVLSPVVGKVVEDSPAAVAGMQENDVILKINGHDVTTWREMSKHIKESDGTLSFMVDRNGLIEYVSITPEITETTNMFKEKVQKRMIGIGSAGVFHRLELSFTETLAYAANETYEASKLIFISLQKLITGVVPAKELGGVVSIVQITAEASEVGWISVLFFAALISVNLGVLNLLPIPALDGGHIMFNLY
ncbi:MAG: M50 family metallopeptidase, partial [Sulfurimonadaceae bacterium]|nr:M50 family metallopeptidase [Sulfurimonadaceae bacterium]